MAPLSPIDAKKVKCVAQNKEVNTYVHSCTSCSLPNLRLATFPPVLLFSCGPKTVCTARATPSLAQRQHLLNKQQFATQNYLTLFRTPPAHPPRSPPRSVSSRRQMFFPARLLFQYLPSQEWSELAAEATASVSPPFYTILCCTAAALRSTLQEL